MKSKITVFVLTVLMNMTLPSALRADAWQDGNRAFAGGDYAQAIEHYKAIIKTTGYSAPLLFNLGNAYQNTHQTGKAILCYERALLLNPSDNEIRKTLLLARNKAGIKEAPLPWWQVPFLWLSPNTWALLGSVLLIAGSLLWSWPRLVRKTGAAAHWSTGLAYGVFAMAILPLCLCIIEVGGDKTGIVVDPGAKLLVSPFPNAETAFNLSEGKKLYIEKNYGDYYMVRTGTGQKGWIPFSQVETLLPKKLLNQEPNTGSKESQEQNGSS